MLIRALMCGMYRLLLMGWVKEVEVELYSIRSFQNVYFEKIEFWKHSFFQLSEPTKSRLAIIVEVDTSHTLYFPSVE